MSVLDRLKSMFRRKTVRPIIDDDYVVVAPMVVGDDAGSDRPRFHSRASESLQVPRGDGLPSVRARLRLAFTPSQPVSDIRMFAGRNDMLLRLIRAIEDQQLHVVLYGDRGMGKTSLLRMLTNLALEARYFVHYVSCSESSDFNATFRSVAAALPIMFHDDYGPTSPEAERGDKMIDLLPDRPVGVAEVSDLFTKISGTRVLIILDEYDRSESDEFHRSIAEMIKTLSDRSSRVQIVIGGVAPSLTTLVEHIPSIRRNVVGIAVGKLNEAELNTLLDIGQRAGGLTFSQAARAAVIHASNGSPYLAGLIGQQSGMAATDADRITVELDDVSLALDRAIEEVEQRVAPQALQALQAITSPAGASILARLARESLDHFGQIAGQAQAIAALVPADSVAVLLRESSDMAGDWRFTDDSIALLLWLREARKSVRWGEKNGVSMADAAAA